MNGLNSVASAWWVWPLLIWAIIWKGLALWRSARYGSVGWFIALMVLNTVGILEILYIYIFSKMGKREA